MTEPLQFDSQTRIKIRTHMQTWNAGAVMRDVTVQAKPEDTISEIISLMVKHNMGEIPVVQGKKYLGVVSRTFLLKRRDLPLSTKAKTVMVKNPTVERDASVMEIADAFVSANARQVFVMENGQLAGMVSRDDVVNVIPKVPDLARIRAEDFINEDVTFVMERDKVSKAIEIMNELDAPVVPVVDRDMRIVGFVGIKNLYDVAKTPGDNTTVGDKVGDSVSTSIDVGSIMATPPLTMDLSENLGQAVNRMLDNSVSTLIAVDENKRPEGILTIYDLLHLLASLKEREKVYVQIAGLGGEESFYLDDVYKEVEDFIDRVKNIVDLHGIDLHYDIYKRGGENKKYSLRGRIMTNKGVYHSRSSEWSPSKVASEVFFHIERQIKTEKDMRLARRYRDR